MLLLVWLNVSLYFILFYAILALYLNGNINARADTLTFIVLKLWYLFPKILCFLDLLTYLFLWYIVYLHKCKYNYTYMYVIYIGVL